MDILLTVFVIILSQMNPKYGVSTSTLLKYYKRISGVYRNSLCIKERLNVRNFRNVIN